MNKLEKLIAKVCPNGVEYKALGKVATIERGVRVVRSQLTEAGNYPVFQNSISPLGFHTEYNCKANTTFVIAAGAAGEIGFSTVEFWAADDCYCILCNDGILDDRFAYYCLMYKHTLLMSKVRKASVPRLARTFVEALEIPIPPLLVQEEIVRMLDDMAGLIGELEQELATRKQQYEWYRDELIKGAMTRGQTELFNVLAQPITDGPHETPEFVADGIPFISVEAIDGNRINFEKIRGCISREYDALCAKKYKPKMGDVFVVKSGSTVGKVAVVDFKEDFNIWSPLAALRPAESYTSKFLYYVLQTTEVQSEIKKSSSHGSQPNIGMRTLERIHVPIVPLYEQKQIVAMLDGFDKLCNSMTDGLPGEIAARKQQYEYYRDKLLTFPRAD